MTARSTVGLLLVAWALSNTAVAQPGRGFRRPSVFDSLRRPEVTATLAITDDELEKLKVVEDESPSFDERFAAALKENPDTPSDDLREATRKQIREETQAKVAEILGKDRAAKLQPLLWKSNGAAALLGPDAAEFLELDDETRDKIRGLSRDYFGARFRLGRDATDEERKAFDAEWTGKFTELLTDEQRQKWTTTLASIEIVAPAEEDEPATEPMTTAESQPAPEPDPRRATTPETPPADPSETTVSFDPTSPAKRDPKAPFSFNFRRAPWNEVLELFAEQANLTLDPEVTPSGEFSYIDDKSYDATGALDVLNGYLLPKGFVLVRRDDFLVCVDLTQPIPPNMVPNVALADLGKRGRNELVSVVIPLGESADPKQTAEEVKAVLGEYGKADPLSVASAIVVRDTAGNAERIARWLTGIEDVDLQAIEFQRFVLEHITAVEAEPLLREQLGVGTGVRNVSMGGSIRSSSLGEGGPPGTVFVQRGPGGGSDEERRRMFYEMMKRRREEEERRRDDDRGRSSSSSSRSSSSSGTVQISVDVRTNSLLMTASRLQLMLAEKIIEAIDVPPDGAYEPAENSGPYLRVYKVSNTDAGEVAKTITAIYEGIVVNEDRSADTIHIWGDDNVQREAATLIRELDGLGSGLQVDVIPLARMDPLSASAMIRSMFLADGEDAPTVEADLYGRRLIVRGSTAHVMQIKSMLAKLGEDGNPIPPGPRGEGRVRTIPLDGRDPDELLPLIEKLWNASNEQSVRIVPNNRPTVRRRYPENSPSRELPLRDETGLRGSRPTTTRPAETPARPEPTAAEPQPTETAPETIDEAPAEAEDSVETTGTQTVAVQADDATDDTESRPPIAITPSGEGIVIVSDDEEALDRFEVFVDTLTRAMPPATQWNVFYLSSADATETATMLEQLIPSASVSSSLSAADQGMFGSLTSGITSMGSSLMEMSGLESAMLTPNTLRIVPDIRSNSLFVAGPPSMIDAVEDLLDVLDESELPDALRDRRPGTIPVEHADVDEVADIVRELYRDQMGGQNQQGGRGGANPLQMLMQQGGNQRGGRGRQQDEARLTLSVDNRTSQLVVSASDALFREIETLVKRLDEDARLARRTTRIVPLQYADALVVQNAVTSLIPKVHVGGTPSRRPTPQPQGSPGGGDRGGDRGGSDAERDAARRIFEQRMRERFGGGQPQPGAGGPFGGGRPGGGRPGGDAGGRPGGGRPGGGRGGRD